MNGTKGMASLVLNKNEATHPNCGNVLRVLPTSLLCENIVNTRGNDLENSNNGRNWKIRSQVPKQIVSINYSNNLHGKGSETRWLWAD